MSHEARLRELGIELPEAPEPVFSYVSAVQTGNLLFVSGHGPIPVDGKMPTGKLGADMDVEAGNKAARDTGLMVLATVSPSIARCAASQFFPCTCRTVAAADCAACAAETAHTR